MYEGLARRRLADDLCATLLERRHRDGLIVDHKGELVHPFPSPFDKSGQRVGVGSASGETDPSDAYRNVVHRLDYVTG